MKDLQLSYIPYSIPFSKPFVTSSFSLSERKGYIIQLKTKSGKTGIGDCAPLPEIGTEDFPSVEEQLKQLRSDFGINLDKPLESVTENLNKYNSLPTLRHALEQAMLNLICNETSVSLDTLLRIKFRRFVDVNAVIPKLKFSDSLSAAEKYISQGFNTLKIKTGSESFEDDLRLIKKIREKFGDEIKIRTDVNGGWDLNSAQENLIQLNDYGIEYCEDPVNNPDDFGKLKEVSPVPLAADELLIDKKNAVEIISNKLADVVIIKPMFAGGMLPALLLSEMARENGIKTVITTSLESVVGRTWAILTAACLSDNTAHGLNTGILLKHDLMPDPLPVLNGRIKVSR
ncbi:MAG: o-succinylbenzoate synthase [Ignavibacteriaceae bacterium]